MAEDKDSLLDLKSELSALATDLSDSEPEGEPIDVSSEMMDLKRRMDKSDQEMRAMTEAMKSTLLDVRALMQDMDNPFNMLREMGVDKLVNKAVETVEDEVMKQKREEAKRRMAGEPEGPAAIVTHYGGAEPPFASSTPSAPSAPSQQEVMPISLKDNQQSPQLLTPADSTTPSQPQVNGPLTKHQEMSKLAPQPQTGSPSLDSDLNSLKKRMLVNEQAVPLILSRISRTEEAINELSNTVHELVEGLKETTPYGGRTSRHRPNLHDMRRSDGLIRPEKSGEVYYEAYISLIADYLILRFGEKGSEEILLEGMYKEWASPNVVRDIMDHLSTSSRTRDRQNSSSSMGLGMINSDVEDKILVTSLLRNLDKPAAEWTEPTHLFLLLALVTRARENKINKA